MDDQLYLEISLVSLYVIIRVQEHTDAHTQPMGTQDISFSHSLALEDKIQVSCCIYFLFPQYSRQN